MKRKLPIILLLLLTGHTTYLISQQLHGKYKQVQSDEMMVHDTEEIIFHKDGSLEYRYISDIADKEMYGKGIYSINKNILLLEFKHFDPPKSEAKIEIWDAVTDSVILLIHVNSFNDHYVLSGAEINILNKAGDIIRKYKSDAEGFCRINLKDNNAANELSIKYQGLYEFNYKIEEKHIELNIEMKHQYPRIYEEGVSINYYMKKDEENLKLKKGKKDEYKLFIKK